jgi:hypothetical protein
VSHIARMQFRVNDLDALEACAAHVGMRLDRNRKNYRWYGRWVGDTPLPEGVKLEDLGKCDCALVPLTGNGYDIGLVWNEAEQSYDLRWDFYVRGGLERLVGEDGFKLSQEYNYETVRKAHETVGQEVYREVLPDGALKMYVRA